MEKVTVEWCYTGIWFSFNGSIFCSKSCFLSLPALHWQTTKRPHAFTHHITTCKSPCFNSAGHVDMMDVPLGMLSACGPLSHCHGYPPMGTHCHGDGGKGWVRISSHDVLSIRPEFTICSSCGCSMELGRCQSCWQWNYNSEIKTTSQPVVVWTLWYTAVKPHSGSSGFLGRATPRVWINTVWLMCYVFVVKVVVSMADILTWYWCLSLSSISGSMG